MTATESVVRDMAKIIGSADATADEREAALATIEEVLFPSECREWPEEIETAL